MITVCLLVIVSCTSHECTVVVVNIIWNHKSCFIYLGKTLQNESQTLRELGMKQDSKLILLGRKVRVFVRFEGSCCSYYIHCVVMKTYIIQYTDEQEELLRPISTVLKAVDGVQTKMDAISEEIKGIEKVHNYV